jgi:hypothetical protein
MRRGNEVAAPALFRLKVPMLFLSAYSNPSMIPKNLSAVPRLHKPLHHDRMLSALRTIWGTSSADEAKSMAEY